VPHQLKDLTHDACLFEDDLITGLPSGFLRADISIPVRSTAEHIDRAFTGGMQLASATTFHDLTPFVFSDDALNL
jgi:hypothetical protein